MNAQPLPKTIDRFAELWALGYHNLIPIVPPGAPLSPHSSLAQRIANGGDDGRGKAPGVKGGDGLWRGLDFPHYVADERDLARWRAWGAGVGIVCRDGLRGIDVDTLDEALAKAFAAEIEKTLGRLPARIGRYPKILYPVRVAGEFPYRSFEFGPAQKKRERIEVLADGKQFVAHGVHPVTHEPYRWARALVPWGELPIVEPEVLAALVERLKTMAPQSGPVAVSGGPVEIDQKSLLGEFATLEAAVKASTNTHNRFPTRESYLAMGYAIKAATTNCPEKGLTLFQEWCAGWQSPQGETNDPAVVDADWRRMKAPYRRGARYIYRIAKEITDGTFDAIIFENNEDIPGETPAPSAEPVAPKKPGIHPTPYRFPDPRLIPPRESLYAGHYIRKWVSSTIAPSKVGKSTLVLAEALAMASGKALLGVLPAGQFRVWWWNGEDPLDELERRAAAAMQHYGLTREDVGDRLLIDSGRDMPINLAIQERSGAKIVAATERELVQAILENRIDVTIFDPFISLHKVSENDNNAIDTVAKKCNDIAGATRSAIELAHHTRKLYGTGATVEDGRGASALLAATRSTRALAKMTKQEAREYGIGSEYKTLFHFTDASSNMFATDPDMEEKWMRLWSVNLGNGEGDDMDKIINGDKVGVATIFDVKAGRRSALEAAGVPETPTSEGLTLEERALEAIRRQDCRKDSRSDEWVGVPIAIALGIDRDSEEGHAQIKSIIREWLREGKLVEEIHLNKARQSKVYVTATVVTRPQVVSSDPSEDLFG